MGDLDGEDSQVRTISKATGVVIVSVDYRLAPAHPYPAPLDDCVTAYDWALKNYSSLGTMQNAAFTFGTSAGGNLALSAALKVIDGGNGHTLKGVVAVVPVTIAPEAVPAALKPKYTSYDEHSEHTINTGLGMKAFFGQSLAHPHPRKRLTFSKMPTMQTRTTHMSLLSYTGSLSYYQKCTLL